MKNLIFTEHAQFIFKSMLAGMLIAMAGGTYLSCQTFISNPDLAKIAGAFLFSIGLIAVILLQANLYTGKIGYVDSRKKAIRAFFMLLINLLMAFLIGLLYRGINGHDISGPFGPDSLRALKPWYKMLFDGFGCGVLIYLAIELNKRTQRITPVIICVMAFILSGTEHCIADAFYFGASQLSLVGLGHLGLAIVGNTIGALAAHWLQLGAEKLNELPNDIQR